jgi:XTP/dITP diphosphohydrolase
MTSSADRRRLLVASTNRDKVAEIRELLAAAPVTVLSLDDVPPVPEPEETGTTFDENARIKALAYGSAVHMLTVAEDSGLVIDALDGEPGVHSARFVRRDASYPERFEEIYRRLARVPERGRAARFVCALALTFEGEILFEARGTVEGEIAAHPSGSAGFGYDPIFYYPPYQRTLADVTRDEKLAVAHRGQAFRALATWLIAHQ